MVLTAPGDLVAWSALWAVVLLLLLAPWLRFLVAWAMCAKHRPEISDPLSVSLNAAGRWGFALLFGLSVLEVISPNAAGYVLLNPADPARWSGFNSAFSLALITGILSVILVAPEIAQLATSKLTGWIDAVFFPGGREKRPPFTLKLAEFYLGKGRWEEAETELARVLSYYPRELSAWELRLRVAFARKAEGEGQEGPEPEEVLGSALRALKEPHEREAIHAAYLRAES